MRRDQHITSLATSISPPASAGREGEGEGDETNGAFEERRSPPPSTLAGEPQAVVAPTTATTTAATSTTTATTDNTTPAGKPRRLSAYLAAIRIIIFRQALGRRPALIRPALITMHRPPAAWVKRPPVKARTCPAGHSSLGGASGNGSGAATTMAAAPLSNSSEDRDWAPAAAASRLGIASAVVLAGRQAAASS